MNELPSLQHIRPSHPPESTQSDKNLMRVAKDLEATFLSEMLKSAGIGKTSETFGGGIGEDQFGSFLRDAQARGMVEAGGIGLAQNIFESLKERTDV